MNQYLPNPDRYEQIPYRRCGNSGLKLPVFSLGLWQNFGDVDNFHHCRDIIRRAFDEGITHFDLANNYGPPPGSAEENFGRILRYDLKRYRDEMIISTKAGFYMWPGPYGDWGSRKYLLASLDQSLQRMGLDYVDIFYHHRPDPETPLEETMFALDHAVKSGKALYVGISNYSAHDTHLAAEILRELKTPFIIHQPRYNMFDRWPEDGLFDTLQTHGLGCIAFSPLAKGLLTGKYLEGVPEGSRMTKEHGLLSKDELDPTKKEQLRKLNKIAERRGQTLAQLALVWLLNNDFITSVLIGVSKMSQLEQNLDTLNNSDLSEDELTEIDEILTTT